MNVREKIVSNPVRIRKGLLEFYAVGVIGFAIPITHDIFQWMTPITLLFVAILLFLFHPHFEKKFILASVLVFLGGFFVEVAGVNTGVIFGEYSYGNTLGLKIWDTPLIIGLNWLVLIYCSHHLTEQLKISPVFKVILGGLIMVVFDLVLEPSAIQTDMWTWEAVHVPVQNYMSWFLISVVFLFIFRGLKLKYKNPVANTVIFAQFLFFLALDIIFFIQNKI